MLPLHKSTLQEINLNNKTNIKKQSKEKNAKMPPPQPPSDTSSHTSSTDTDSNNNDENWLTQPGAEDDDEDREESVPVVSLFDDQVFPDAVSMLAHCRDKHGFDFLAVRDGLGLDFLGCVRLINLGE